MSFVTSHRIKLPENQVKKTKIENSYRQRGLRSALHRKERHCCVASRGQIFGDTSQFYVPYAANTGCTC